MHSGRVDSEEVELSAVKDWPDGGIVFCSLLTQWPDLQDLGLYVRRVACRSGDGLVMVDYSMTFARVQCTYRPYQTVDGMPMPVPIPAKPRLRRNQVKSRW